jgi:uncharacterized protein YdeI (YjbR/CyaY-like superfamily)
MPVRRTAVAIALPKALAHALKQNAKAAAAFDRFPPSHQREYAKWIAEARTEPTRERRVAQALTRIVTGKSSG